jgi:hypothetical protein
MEQNIPSHQGWGEVCAIDMEGKLRGKLVSSSSLSTMRKDGLGFSSYLFLADCKDQPYPGIYGGSINAQIGDVVGRIDEDSVRTINWKNDRRLYLVRIFVL